MDYVDSVAVVAQALKFSPNALLYADERDRCSLLTKREQGSFDRSGGSEIAPHRVKTDFQPQCPMVE